MKSLRHDVRSNLYKSKKMKEVSLWNDLPWLHNDFQVGKVQISTTIGKFLGFSILSNHRYYAGFLEQPLKI